MRYIKCGHAFDSESGKFRGPLTYGVDDLGRIATSDPSDSEVSRGELLDLSQDWVIPGLVDAHDHFGIDRGDGAQEAAHDLQWRALKGAKNARAILRSGVTTMRSAGEKGGLGNHIRAAIGAGWLPGPRTFLSGQPISSTGGHGCSLGIEADGPDAVRAAVRRNIKDGADMIKMIITAGTTTKTGALARPCFQKDEVDAAVGECRIQERRIGVHCYGGDAATWAIEAGVTSIEHGTYLSDGQLEAMAEQGIFLVSTASVMGAAAADPNVRPFMRERFAQVERDYVSLLERARRIGVPMATGCDTNHASMADEIAILAAAGHTASEVLQIATRGGATLCGLQSEVGDLKPGHYADMVVVDQTVVDDPASAVRAATRVIKGGAEVRGAC